MTVESMSLKYPLLECPEPYLKAHHLLQGCLEQAKLLIDQAIRVGHIIHIRQMILLKKTFCRGRVSEVNKYQMGILRLDLFPFLAKFGHSFLAENTSEMA